MITIIDYNAGNVHSVKSALKRLDCDYIISDSETEILNANKVIFPGVGNAETALNYLKNKGLNDIIPSIKVPFLGICLGMQILCDYLEEANNNGLGIFENRVDRFFDNQICPHTGWNSIKDTKTDLFKGIDNNTDFYFVHSYKVEISNDTISKTDNGVSFSSALNKDNFYGVQFHPEKSGVAGNQLLKNFLEL